MSKVLVTGGAGYIGSHVVKKLLEKNFSVIVYDNLSTGHIGAVGKAKLVIGDLADTKKLEQTIKNEEISSVMHFAGSIIVPESVTNPLLYYKNNTENSLNLIRLCLENSVSSFIFSSTAAVYGTPKNRYASEQDMLLPINPYGQSKLMTELMLRDISSSEENFNYIALRYFNVSGADPDKQIGQAFPGATHLIKVNCEAAAGKREKTFIFGTDFDTEDGTGVRDYIHVSDLADAHVLALEDLMKYKKSDVFNCGYGKGFSVKEVVSAVKRVTNSKFDVEVTSRRDGDPDFLVSDVSKIKEKLSWKPKYENLDFIIKTAFEWEMSETLKKWQQEKNE